MTIFSIFLTVFFLLSSVGVACMATEVRKTKGTDHYDPPYFWVSVGLSGMLFAAALFFAIASLYI